MGFSFSSPSASVSVSLSYLLSSSDPDDHNEKMAEKEAVDKMEVVDQVERMEVMEEVKGVQADDLDPSSLHSSASPPSPSPQPVKAAGADAMEDSSVPPPTPSSSPFPPPPVSFTTLFLTPSTSSTHRAPSTSHTSSGPHPHSWERRKPDAPKKASNAFHIFYNAYRDGVKQRHPELSFSNIRTELGWAWRGMSLEERKPYEDRAAADRERYQKEMLDYQASQQPDRRMGAQMAVLCCVPVKLPRIQPPQWLRVQQVQLPQSRQQLQPAQLRQPLQLRQQVQPPHCDGGRGLKRTAALEATLSDNGQHQ